MFSGEVSTKPDRAKGHKSPRWPRDTLGVTQGLISWLATGGSAGSRMFGRSFTLLAGGCPPRGQREPYVRLLSTSQCRGKIGWWMTMEPNLGKRWESLVSSRVAFVYRNMNSSSTFHTQFTHLSILSLVHSSNHTSLYSWDWKICTHYGN